MLYSPLAQFEVEQSSSRSMSFESFFLHFLHNPSNSNKEKPSQRLHMLYQYTLRPVNDATEGSTQEAPLRAS